VPDGARRNLQVGTPFLGRPPSWTANPQSLLGLPNPVRHDVLVQNLPTGGDGRRCVGHDNAHPDPEQQPNRIAAPLSS